MKTALRAPGARGELVLTAVFGLAGIAIVLGAYSFQDGATYLSGPRVFPQGAGAIMTLAAIARAVMLLRGSPSAQVMDEQAAAADIEDLSDGGVGAAKAVETSTNIAAEPEEAQESPADSEPVGPAARVMAFLQSATGMTIVSIGYVLILGRLGFVVATTIYCWALAIVMHPRGWRGALPAFVVALAVVAVAWVVFVYWLRAPLPRGVFG